MRFAFLCGLLLACNPDPTSKPAPTTQPTSPPTSTPTATSPPTSHPTPTHTVLPATGASKGSLYDLDLNLENQDGKPLTLRSFEGQAVIISMFYSKCGYACPTLIQDIQILERALTDTERKGTHVLLVSFDPEYDTPAVLASLAARHGVDTTHWTFARTPPDQGDEPTRELAGALGVKYRRLEDGHYNHSSLITLLDKSGIPLARIDGLRQDSTAFRAIVGQALSGEGTRP